MTDYLLSLSQNPYAKSLVKRLRLPVPLPEPLKRQSGPWDEELLAGKVVAVGGPKDKSPLQDVIAKIVTRAGGEAVTSYDAEKRHDALVLDATTLASASDLGHIYEFFKPRLQSLRSSCRIIIIGAMPESSSTPAASAAQTALLGFVKSLGKELGRKGGTAQLVSLAPEARDEAHLALPLAFLLSNRSAFISGQVLRISAQVDPLAPTNPLPWLKPLQGKTALVTGAAQGIGADIAVKLAEEGAKVIGLDRPAQQGDLERVMEKCGGQAWAFDLLDPTAVKAIAARVETEFGGLDILVNNAGITRDKTLARMPRDWWDDAIALNFQVPVALTESISLRPGARVILLSSISGIGGNGGQTNYSTAKAGLIGYAAAAAPRLAPKGITINAVAPGFIATEMTKRVPLATREVARRLNALNQAGEPRDIAEAIAMLTSPGAFGITGTTLRVCGLNLMGA